MNNAASKVRAMMGSRVPGPYPATGQKERQ